MIPGVDDISRAALRAGIERPNNMQLDAWRSGARRLVILSPTGSGKTVAFAGALMRRLGAASGNLQAVVLAPSRELVLQIASVLRVMCPKYKVSVFYGNHSVTDEKNTLSVTPDIAVATPGRFLDHLSRGNIDPSAITALVIDEYDKCLEMGFRSEMSRIVRYLRALRNVILTSATAIPDLPDFIDMKGAETVDNTAEAAKVVSRLHIARVESDTRDKLDTIETLLLSLPPQRIIIFVNHREAAERVYDRLHRDGFAVSLYHGGLEQDERERAVICLSNGSLPVMVATDLAARGLDIEAVGAVVHYHLPVSPQAWTHRNGRTARVDARGNVYIITAPSESLPDYVNYDNDLTPRPLATVPARPSLVTLYINAGRREKISRGDIAGYLIKTAGVQPGDVGVIDIRDHCAYVAVARAALPVVLSATSPRIKGKRVRITPLKSV